MVEHKRILSAYLDDLRQGLQAPVQSIAAYADFLCEHFSASGDGGVRDVQRIRSAASELLAGIDLIADQSPDRLSLSVVRHDMRNAIGLVSGYAELLLEDDAAVGDRKAVEYLQLILRESLQFQQRLEALGEGDFRSDTASIEQVFSSFSAGVRREGDDSGVGRVLVVDDNPSNRELLVHQLQREGHHTLEATSGREGLAKLRSEQPDVVLLDLLMPDLNGYDVLQAIRADDALRHIPVVMISGIKDQEGAIRCIDAGASDYLSKPVNTTLLRARVAALLERKRWQDKERVYLAELEKSRDFIRSVFGRYLSDEVVQQLLDERGGLNLGGERRQVTMLMADIRGFSTVSQQLSPEECVQLLNNYLAVMADVIMDYGGTVDEFIGDAILAIFGAPVSGQDDAERALACALAMQHAVAAVNDYNRDHGLPDIEIGIGLNTGPVVVGNIGSERRSKYGVVGHHVNLTSRIESCSVGGQVLASEHTVGAIAARVESERVLEVSVKGADTPLKLYDVVGLGGPHKLSLSRPEAALVAIAPLPVKLHVLRDKRFDEIAGGGELLALNARQLRLQSALALPMFGDVCIKPMEAAVEAFFAKVTDIGDGDCYTLTMTSVPEAVASYLLALPTS